MPTGYTAEVADGKITDLAPFVLQLARGMMPLIQMRDDPADAPIPERLEPSDYNAKKLTELRAERLRLTCMTADEAQAAADKTVAEYEAALAKAESEFVETRKRYDAMIAKVVDWQGGPEGLKDFAVEQLNRGRDFDCGHEFKYYSERPADNGSDWRKAALDKLRKEIEYHAIEDAKERERTIERNLWLSQLHRSLANESEA